MNRIQPGVYTNPLIVVFPSGTLAVNAERANQRLRLVVIDKNCASVTVTTQGLGGEKRRGRDLSEGAGPPSLIGRTEALGGILDQGKAIFFTDGCDGVIITGVSKNIHSNHYLGSPFPLCQNGLDLTL